VFRYELDRPGWSPDWLDPEVLDTLRSDLDARQVLEGEFVQLEEDQRVMQTEVMRSGDTGCNLPVNLRRLIENAQRKFACRPHKRGPTGERARGLGGLACAACLLPCCLARLSAS
jgi:DNA-directed RNA polymerase II subunit RPB1